MECAHHHEVIPSSEVVEEGAIGFELLHCDSLTDVLEKLLSMSDCEYPTIIIVILFGNCCQPLHFDLNSLIFEHAVHFF